MPTYPMPRLASSRRLGVTLVLVVACGTSSSSADESESTGASGSGGGDTGDGLVWPPAACDVDASPFLSAECLTALRDGCLSHELEGPCAERARLEFADGEYGVRCVWAKVTTFADASTCTGPMTVGRCEATVEGLTCMDSCASAVPSAGEIIEVCGGPLGAWAAVGAPADEVSLCAPNVTPPPPPLCDCAPMMCTQG